MNCRKIKKLLVPFLESELSESSRGMLEAHLHNCDACQKEKMLLEQTWSMLDGFKVPAVRNNFTSNLMAKIHDLEEAGPKFTFVFPEINIQFGFRVLAPAMAAVCVLIVAYFFVQNQLIQEQRIAKVVLPEQKTILQAKKNVSSESRANVAGIISSERKRDLKNTTTEFAKNEKAGITATDEEIIRNLDVYENVELYQNYALLDNFDVVENLGAEVL